MAPLRQGAVLKYLLQRFTFLGKHSRRSMMNEIEIFGERPMNKIYEKMMNRLKNFRRGGFNVLFRNRAFNGRQTKHSGEDAIQASCKSLLDMINKRKILKVNKTVRRAKVIGYLQSTFRDVITKVGVDALSQLTTYQMLSITEKHMPAFKRGLGFEIGMYLFSRYNYLPDPCVTKVQELVGQCRLHPKGAIKVEDWFPQVCSYDSYESLFK